MIIQGANNPLVITFDTAVDSLPRLVVTLWRDISGYGSKLLKTWELEDMTVSGATAICPLSEAETSALPAGELVLSAKGLDGDGSTVFWDEYPIDVKQRRDKAIVLTQTEG